jgi:hypothetical protein
MLPSSRPKSKKSQEIGKMFPPFLFGILLGLLFDPEGRGSMLVQNCSGLLPDYTDYIPEDSHCC